MEKELGEKLNKIEEGIEEIKTDVSVNTKAIGAMKTDIGAMKTDIGAMKTDIGTNKTNILAGFKEAKTERAEIKTKINETYNAVDGFTKIVTKLEDEFATIKEDLKRVKEVIKEKLGIDLF